MSKKLYIKLLEGKVEALQIENNRLRDLITKLNAQLAENEKLLQTKITREDVQFAHSTDNMIGIR